MFSGLMPAMVTPFDERGKVDLGVAEAVVVEHLIGDGVDGISALGSTGDEEWEIWAGEEHTFGT